MRSFVALVLVSCLAACGGSGAKAPGWPQMAARTEDGGESLAPRKPGVVTERADDEPEEKPTRAAEVPETKPAEAAKEPSTPPAASTPVVAPEEVIDLDEIVIEVED